MRTNFADAGFGVSQIFPIIVAGLSAKKGSYLIFEQPEIHLNPRLQSILAQLFAYFVSEGINLIVETHSEHFLLRLRQIIASGQLKSDKVNLYYVEKEEERSLIRKIFIKENGHIDSADWPKGFFDETLRGALELAGAQVVRARKLKRGRNRGRKQDVKGRSR